MRAAPGTARARLDDRLAAREPVGEHVHEASERRTADSRAGPARRRCRLHRYQMPPALQPPVSCRCAGALDRAGGQPVHLEGDRARSRSTSSRPRTRCRSPSRSRGRARPCSAVCCSSRSARRDAGVGLVLDVEGLHRGLRRARVRLRVRVVRLVLLGRERGDRDRRQQPDDDQDHQQLDQREPALLPGQGARPRCFMRGRGIELNIGSAPEAS